MMLPRNSMNNEALADEIITRLNNLCADPHVRTALASLIDARVRVRPEVEAHPTIQVVKTAGQANATVGFIGILNGLIGAIPEGEKKGWGYIAANYSDDDGKPEAFTGFVRTDATIVKSVANPFHDVQQGYDRRGVGIETTEEKTLVLAARDSYPNFEGRTGIGITKVGGRWAIAVRGVDDASMKGLPDEWEGFPVEKRATGVIKAL
jgi:hypothetical protein